MNTELSVAAVRQVLNRRCVEAGVLVALALKAQLHPVSTFDRKHYFYCDLPAGYQITQYRQPIATGGRLQYVYQPPIHSADYKLLRESDDEAFIRSVRFKQIQLEHDSGRSMYIDETAKDSSNDGRTLVDLNRSGVGLLEIITEPDLGNEFECMAMLRELIHVLDTIGVLPKHSSEGSFRVDVNVSVGPEGGPLGKKVEVKNVGSVTFVRRAVSHEIARQIKILKSGGTILSETRGFNAKDGMTVPLRGKDKEQHDYRFMPEPDLPPLFLDLRGLENLPYGPQSSSEKLPQQLFVSGQEPVKVANIFQTLPRLPHEQREMLMVKYGLNVWNSFKIESREGAVDYFKDVAGRLMSEELYQRAAHWTANTVFSLLDKQNLPVAESPVSAEQLADLLNAIHRQDITLKTAKHVFKVLASQGGSVVDVIERHNLRAIRDVNVIQTLLDEFIVEQDHVVKKLIVKNPQGLKKHLGSALLAKHNGRLDFTTLSNIVDKCIAEKCAELKTNSSQGI